MAELITAAQMRAIEAEAIASGRVTGLELMERAGRGVVEAIFEEWPELAATSRRAVVLCGPGNNGGDGFVVARLLKEWGWEVEAYLYGDPDKLPPDARVNYERWNSPTRSLFDVNDAEIFDFDVVVDALFGTGLVRPVQNLSNLFGTLRMGMDTASPTILEGPPFIVAVDAPSGLDMDSGKVLGETDAGLETGLPSSAVAHLTVAFHSMKHGHILAEGPSRCGKAVVASIGIEGRPPGQLEAPIELADVDCVAGIVKRSGHHKYNHGHAVVLSGAMGRSGAARLAARAALRVGAGLVTVAAPGSAMMECATQLTAIMLRKCKGAEGLATLLEDKRLNALCLGPGLGVGQETRDLVGAALADPARGVVLDADALTSFADDPNALFSMLHPKVVLTPHAGEFARLFPDIADKLNAPATTGPAYSKVDATRAAAERAGCVVLFKGPDTVIADPNGAFAINAAVYDRAAPWLATAGSGDVLAGLITGLIARGLSPMQASETAAWLHVEAARAFGPGLIAEDLPEMLPQVFRDLGL
ncbi:NAD(P)H-hydrate dehydratase [Rhodobacteraceae bacterium N5(2021)]|uniref:Bifunctional NAD(P)H-hydrate repair enzyme n=1 Tax=Gymnodinialimonas phycosphaerae TaxID=2841589 RepID=A0A975TWQ6_9RHOB|nr:NAD(P)H-hydrate dehydratase [Gymnodinialimonas phycosphaerae]MBY4891377.1 NAD(P)H-hydrate dehydratase [Gymnodinialimonas phycosphaerae]